jgi:chorismate synthase
MSHVVQIGRAKAPEYSPSNSELAELAENASASSVGCADNEAAQEMMKEIDLAAEHGDTLGGVFGELCPLGSSSGFPFGSGNHGNSLYQGCRFRFWFPWCRGFWLQLP